MKFENTWTGNWEGAFHGLRHPMESYAKGDTKWYEDTPTLEHYCGNQAIEVNSDTLMFLGMGENDKDLAQRMIKAGTPNDKFLRQIFVTVDITAAIFCWMEADQYKVGTTTNSCSTMHKLASTPITMDNFEVDNFAIPYFIDVVKNCEELRVRYNETKDKNYWRALIQLLPESWLQMRTITLNYQVLRTMYFDRRYHKLSEWNTDFVNWLKTLPYAEELIMYEDKEMVAKAQKEMKA